MDMVYTLSFYPARTSSKFTIIGLSPNTETVPCPVCKTWYMQVASSSHGDEISLLREESKHIV